MTVDYAVQQNVAVITLNNPPVNGLGFATRVALTDGLARALADASVNAIVITGVVAASTAWITQGVCRTAFA